MTLQPVFHLKWHPLPKRVQISRKAAPTVFMMNSLSPLISGLLFWAASSELEPAVIAVVALSIGIDAPDHDRRLDNKARNPSALGKNENVMTISLVGAQDTVTEIGRPTD
jgi:hypothetical protein